MTAIFIAWKRAAWVSCYTSLVVFNGGKSVQADLEVYLA